jgi:hypothetical protein
MTWYPIILQLSFIFGAGFFKRHKDFLSTTSNLIEEYTLLLCVTPADQAKGVIGGNTTIHTFGGAKTFDTTTTGSGILFRKDLEHEGMELMSGEKHIITANVWATRTEQSKQVLLVTFPPKENGGIDSKLSIEEVANTSMSYVLPVDNLSGMLLAHVQWANRAAESEGKDEPPVVTYECCDYDFETFGVVEKVLNRSYVDEQLIHGAKDCLDFFGPFKAENILVNLALESNSEAKEGATVSPQRKKARTSFKHDTFDKDLIICETEARMRAVANAAAVLGENSYVPFRLLFVEGVMQADCEGDLSVVDVPMMAIACLLGDYDSVFCLRNICHKESVEPMSFFEIHTESNLFQKYPPSIIKNILADIQPGSEVDFFDRNADWEGTGRDQCDVQNELKVNGYGLGLKVGLKASNEDIKSAIVSSCVHEPYDMLSENTKTVYLPGIGKNDDMNTLKGDATFFHRNEEGKVALTSEEADNASNFIASFGLEERVKSALQKKRFVLPQQADQVDQHFCNEQVYGTINILWVCGVIRMEADYSAEAGNGGNRGGDDDAEVELEIRSMNIKSMKSELKLMGVSLLGLVEKEDLVVALLQARRNHVEDTSKFDVWPSKEANAKIERDRTRFASMEREW